MASWIDLHLWILGVQYILELYHLKSVKYLISFYVRFEEAFQRDKAKKNSHTGWHNTDNSFRIKERDGSNRYNNSDTNREHERHPRY